jgi:hypothetical protein
VDELLIPAIEEEYNRQLSLYQSLISEFGEDIKKKNVVYSIREAIEEAQNAGVFGHKDVEKLLETVVEFHKTKFDSYITTMKKIKTELIELNSPNFSSPKLLPYLSEDYEKVMTVAEEFLKRSNKFLEMSLNHVQDDINKLTSATGEEDIETLNLSITNNLDNLSNLLKEIQD